MLLRLPYMKLLGVSQIRTTFTSLQGPETGDTKPQQNPRARNYNQLCLRLLFWTEKNMNSGPGSGPILEPTGRPQKWDLLVPDNKAAPKQGTKCGPSAGTINLRKLQPHFKPKADLQPLWVAIWLAWEMHVSRALVLAPAPCPKNPTDPRKPNKLKQAQETPRKPNNLSKPKRPQASPTP